MQLLRQLLHLSVRHTKMLQQLREQGLEYLHRKHQMMHVQALDKEHRF